MNTITKALRLADAVLKGGPGSGPHPSATARSSKQHDAAAKYHQAKQKEFEQKGNTKAAEAHEDAANMHSASSMYPQSRGKTEAGHTARALSVKANKF